MSGAWCGVARVHIQDNGGSVVHINASCCDTPQEGSFHVKGRGIDTVNGGVCAGRSNGNCHRVGKTKDSFCEVAGHDGYTAALDLYVPIHFVDLIPDLCKGRAQQQTNASGSLVGNASVEDQLRSWVHCCERKVSNGTTNVFKRHIARKLLVEIGHYTCCVIAECQVPYIAID